MVFKSPRDGESFIKHAFLRNGEAFFFMEMITRFSSSHL